MFRQMISESEIEFKELSLEEEKLNSDIDNEELLKNQAIKKSIKVSLSSLSGTSEKNFKS